MEPTRMIRDDQGKINERLLKRYGATDMSRIESATRTIPTTLNSPEAKRLFMRFYHSMQLSMHYISVHARAALPGEEIEAAEAKIMDLIKLVTLEIDQEIASAEKAFRKNGVTDLGSYRAQPLIVDVIVISRFGRRYLELFGKIDQLMLMLEMLAMDEIIELPDQQKRKVRFKRAVQSVAQAALAMRTAFHKRINPAARKAGGEPVPNGSANRGDEAGQELVAPTENDM